MCVALASNRGLVTFHRRSVGCAAKWAAGKRSAELDAGRKQSCFDALAQCAVLDEVADQGAAAGWEVGLGCDQVRGRLSGLVLTALPFIVGTFMFLYNPEYFAPMIQRRVGNMLLLYGVVSLLVGHLMVRRIVKIEV